MLLFGSKGRFRMFFTVAFVVLVDNICRVNTSRSFEFTVLKSVKDVCLYKFAGTIR